MGSIEPGAVIDLRSDLMAPRPLRVAAAMQAAALRPPAMEPGEDADERALLERLACELGVEAAVLTPTCTMANQIAIRLHLPQGGVLAASARAHVMTVEARATALTGVALESPPDEDGHLSPAAVANFLSGHAEGAARLVWLENTHMLAAGSIMPAGWQAQIGAMCRAAGAGVHLDGSRLWNVAAGQGAPMSALADGADTVAVSLNKAIGAPLGSVLAGSRAAMDEAVRWRDVMGGGWRPVGVVAAAALAALDGWRERLATDAAMTGRLAAALAARLGEACVRPAPSNLIFLDRPDGDGPAFVEALARHGVRALALSRSSVRLAIHSGVREREVEIIAAAAVAAVSG